MILIIVYSGKFAIAAKISQLFGFSLTFFKTLMSKISFVMMNEGIWAVGTTCYTIMYARMGTDIAAAMNISMTLFELLFIFSIGIGSAIAIMIGNSLGAEQYAEAKVYAKKGMVVAAGSGLVIAILMLLVRNNILSLYSVDESVIDYAKTITNFVMIYIPINCVELTLFLGILRAGGDTKFCTYVDIGALWLVGLPLALLGAFVFHLPLGFVYLLSRTESITRVILCYRRYKTFKWVQNVT